MTSTDTRTDRAALARESIAAFDRCDWDALRALCDPAIVYEETGSGRRIDGIDDLIEGLQGWRAAFPDMVGDVRRVAVDGDVTTMEVYWRATHTGPLVTPSGALPPRGTVVETWWSMWLTWSGGVIVHERNHLDLLTMLTRLGALPAGPPPAPASR